MVSNREPAHSLVEYAVSGAEIAAAPCLLALAVAHLPLCLGLYAAGQLSFGIHSILCSGSRPHIVLQPFTGKLSLSFISSLEIPQFELLSQVSPLRLSSRHSGLVLPYPKHKLPLSSPCLLVVNASGWATTPLAVVVRHIFSGVFFFFFLPIFSPGSNVAL